ASAPTSAAVTTYDRLMRRWWVGALAISICACSLVVDLSVLGSGATSDAASDAPADGTANASELVLACIAAATCDGVSVADCFDSYGTPVSASDSVVACIVAAHGDCTAIAACNPLSSRPWDGGKSITCEGSLLVDCEGAACTVIACDKFYDQTATCLYGA